MAVEGVIFLRYGLGVERASGNYVGPCFEIGAVNIRYHIGAREHKYIVVAFKLDRMAGEFVAAKICFGEAAFLYFRSHGPVENKDAAFQLVSHH